jgi:hypothetical protein
MLIPQVVGFQADRRAARGRHRHRPGADRHRDAAQARRGRQVRRVLRPRASPTCRWPTAPPSPTWRPSTAPPAASSRRRGDARYLRFTGREPSRSRWSRPTCQGAGPVPHRRHARSRVHRHPRARPGHRRAQPGRPQAAAGPRALKRLPSALACAQASARARPPRAGAGAARRWRAPGAPARSHGHAPTERVRARHGDVVIAAITSCTNTSNPSVMVAPACWREGRRARPRTKPWVKTSLAPGSKVVTDYLDEAGLLSDLEQLGFTWSATAAPPASATPARCRSRSARPSRRATWSPPRCSRATATSRAASTPRSRPTTWPRRRWWWPTRWPAPWTST